ncbi:MAG TPA: hypothetical protein VF135_02170 [Terriglobales bacterium]
MLRTSLGSLVLCTALAVYSATAQNFSSAALPPTDPASNTSTSTRGGYLGQPQLVGTYLPDGTYRKATKPNQIAPSPSIAKSVPNFVDRPTVGRVVQDFVPPGHATQRVKSHSLLANLRDSIIRFAYGKEQVLLAPTHVTTDSQQRLIICDPGTTTIHVLEPTGLNSFRIVGGPGRRLLAPASVAVDAEDNIYVGDVRRGLILMYDRYGRFLRVLGSYHGESMFDRPTALAIDQKARRMYVLDSPVNQLVVLDLNGTLIKRVGGDRDKGRIQFDAPTEIAVDGNRIAILDSAGSRIQTFDLDCNLLGSFLLRNQTAPYKGYEVGLALDAAGNVYLSNVFGSTVRVYRQDGRLLAILGHPGADNYGFSAPSGLWVDSAARVYVADTNNRRVQVYQQYEVSIQQASVPRSSQ